MSSRFPWPTSRHVVASRVLSYPCAVGGFRLDGTHPSSCTLLGLARSQQGPLFELFVAGLERGPSVEGIVEEGEARRARVDSVVACPSSSRQSKVMSDSNRCCAPVRGKLRR
jgi:hypothetical protein